MESFAALRRRATDILQSIPSVPTVTKKPAHTVVNGTWEKIGLPPLPRSSHSVNVVSGTAYVFGGELESGKLSDNDVHIIKLPMSLGASADCYAIKSVASKPDVFEPEVPTLENTTTEHPEDLETQDEAAETLLAKGKDLDDVPLSESPETSTGKGKEREVISAPSITPPPSNAGQVPSSRLGHATAVIGSRIFLFGGTTGPDDAPIDEGGRVWVFDTRNNTWSSLDPLPPAPGVTQTPRPAPRSYHSATSIERPQDFPTRRPQRAGTWKDWAAGDSATVGIPQAPIIGNVAADARDPETDGYGTFFIHGGRLSGAEYTNDVWAFDVRSRVWKELPSAPGPARSGAGLCLSKSRLFRFGGSDAESHVLGGQLDFLHLEVETFDDDSGKGEVAITARGGWQTIAGEGTPGTEQHEILDKDHTQAWPGARNVLGFEALTTGGGREYLVLAMGEREARSSLFWDDVWVFQVPPLGMSTASLRDAVMLAMGRNTGEGQWTRVVMGPRDDENDDEVDGPEPRGFFATAPMTELEERGVLLWGGLGAGSRRLGDGWILRVG